MNTEQFDAHIQGPWVAVWSDTYAAKLGIEGPTYDARWWSKDHIVSILVEEKWAREWSAESKPCVEDEGLTVALLDVSHVDDSEWDYGQEYSSTQGTNREMYDATARLIAAAPDLLAEVKRLREENRVLDEKLAQSEFALGGFRREALLRRSIQIRQVSCDGGVVCVTMKDENGHLYRYRAPAVDTVVGYGVSHLEPVSEQPEGMGGGYVTGWTEQPTPESKPLRFDSHKVEFIELMPDEEVELE